ncbi:MAG: hypothetical protein LC737_05620, partial [Chloroflexi bacterium]|nr:hypothetical protein [Chloroflexota bacterium]
VVHNVFDHTSIIKTVCNRWNLPPLSERDKAANDLSEALTLDTPRADVPVIEPKPFERVPCPEDEPLNDFQKGVLALVAGISGLNRVDEDKHITDRVADLLHIVENEAQIYRLKTIGQAWQFMRDKLHLTFQYENVHASKPSFEKG